MSLNYPVVQVAYFVKDSVLKAQEMAELHGAGPFYLIEEIELACSIHRRKEQKFVHTSAFGQWGGLM